MTAAAAAAPPASTCELNRILTAQTLAKWPCSEVACPDERLRAGQKLAINSASSRRSLPEIPRLRLLHAGYRLFTGFTCQKREAAHIRKTSSTLSHRQCANSRSNAVKSGWTSFIPKEGSR